jgi:hypothetical protein
VRCLVVELKEASPLSSMKMAILTGDEGVRFISYSLLHRLGGEGGFVLREFYDKPQSKIARHAHPTPTTPCNGYSDVGTDFTKIIACLAQSPHSCLVPLSISLPQELAIPAQLVDSMSDPASHACARLAVAFQCRPSNPRPVQTD